MTVGVRVMENGGGGWKLDMNGLLVKRLVARPCDCVKFQGPYLLGNLTNH